MARFLRGFGMKRYDVIYILKQGAGDSELRYSLRSIEKNMQHGDVWFVCGQPRGLVPDHRLEIPQTEPVKWDRVRGSLFRVCSNNDVPDKFWLFNDDFFVLKPMASETPMYQGLMRDHILRVEKKYHGITDYTRHLRECEATLKGADLPTFDYAVHMPMLIDKAKMLEALKVFPDCPMFRCLYGNYAVIGGEIHDDVKIVELDEPIPDDADFVSTCDAAFAQGIAGRQIMQMFRDKCRYEI